MKRLISLTIFSFAVYSLIGCRAMPVPSAPPKAVPALPTALPTASSTAVAATATPQPIKEVPIKDAATTTLDIPGFPDWMEIGFGSLWISNMGKGVQRLDLKTKQIVATIPLKFPCATMTVGFDSVWAADCTERKINRIDPKTNQIIAKIDILPAETESSISAGEGGVWVVSDRSNTLSRIDPATNTVVQKIKIKDLSSAVMAGLGGVWVTSSSFLEKHGNVQRIDPLTNSVVATITVSRGARFLAVGEGGVWGLSQSDGTVAHIDPQTNQVVATIQTGIVGSGGDIAAGEGAVWVRGAGPLLIVIDPKTNQVIKKYGPSQGSGAVRAGEGSVWVSAHDVNKIWELAP